MTETDRDRLRALQDRWLALPSVKNHVRNHGEGERIAGPNSPTFAQVKTQLLPDWEQWLRDFFT